MIDGFVDQIVALDSFDEQFDLAVDRLGLTLEATDDLLETAESWIHRNPIRGRQLVAIASRFADDLDAAELAAKAQYFTAVGHGVQGEFDRAIDLSEIAQRRFEQLGMSVEALRCVVGRSGFLAAAGQMAQAGRLLSEMLETLPTSDQAQGELRLVEALARQNLGTILIGGGDLESGVMQLDGAAAIFESLEEFQRLVQISANRVPALLGLGRATLAIETLEHLAEQFNSADDPYAIGVLSEELGGALTMSGDLAPALTAYERSIEAYTAAEMATEARRTELRLGQLLLSLYLISEADEVLDRVADSLETDPHPYHSALLNHVRGLAEHDRGDHDQAQQFLTAAHDKFDALGLNLDAALCRLDLVETLSAGDLLAESLAAARAIVESIPDGSWPVVRLLGSLQVAKLAPEPDVAESDQQVNAAIAAFGTDLPAPLSLLVDQHRAERARRLGDDTEAIRLLERVVEQIEMTRNELSQDRHRRAFLGGRLSAFESLFAVLVERGDSESLRRAFEVVEQARSRSLLDVLSSSPGVVSGDEAGLQEIRNLRRDLDALYNQLLDDDGSSRGVRLSQQSERARSLEQKLTKAIDAAAVGGVERGVRAPSFDDVVEHGRLASTTILSFYTHDDSIYAFVVSADEVALVRLEASQVQVARNVRRVRAQMERFRLGPEFVSRWQDQMKDLANSVLGELYEQIWAPIAPHLVDVGASDSRLLIIPSGFLSDVPFPALYDGHQFLLERYEFTVSPSAAAWMSASTVEDPLCESVIVANRLDLLPHVEREAEATAAQLESSGLKVTRLDGTAGLDQYPRPAVLHLACHGVFRSDNPVFSALKLGDGWLTASEIAALDLRGTIVVLSACESGRVAWVQGQEVAGLARSFLASGARAVVGSNWLVDDRHTADLMQVVYSKLCRGTDIGDSLRSAQLGALTQDWHPFSWAAFTILGAGHIGLTLDQTPSSPETIHTEGDLASITAGHP